MPDRLDDAHIEVVELLVADLDRTICDEMPDLADCACVRDQLVAMTVINRMIGRQCPGFYATYGDVRQWMRNVIEMIDKRTDGG